MDSQDINAPSDISNSCNVYNDVFPMIAIAYLDGDVLTDAEIQQFTASYSIDGGASQPFTFDTYSLSSGGFSDINFTSTLDCTLFKDGQTHQITNSLVDHLSNVTTTTNYFTHPSEGIPAVSVDSLISNELSVTSLPFTVAGLAEVNNDTIAAVQMTIDGGAAIDATASNSPFDTNSEGFTFPDLTQYNGTHAAVVSARAAVTNTTTNFPFSIVVNVPGNDAPASDPNLSITQANANTVLAGNSTILTGVASISAGVTDTIAAVRFSIDSAVTDSPATPTDGTFDGTDEAFSINIGSIGFSSGTYTLTVVTESALGATTQQVYTMTVDSVAPTCGTTWYNQPSPAYSNVFTYENIVCTDDTAIGNAEYRIYHYIDGELLDTAGDGYLPIASPSTGSYGDASVTLGFSATAPTDTNHDGAVDINFRAFDTAGNSVTYVDPMVIDYADQTAPNLSLQLIRPDPISDLTPTITGTCSDVATFETNTTIASIEVNIDGNTWESVNALDGTFDSATERFSYTLPTLSIGAHEIDVRCADSASNVNSTGSTEDINFSIQDPGLGGIPSITNFPESFDTHTYQDLAESTLIWGNGQLRLKEELIATRSAIDTAGFRDRYSLSGDSNTYNIINSVTPDYAWYVKTYAIARLQKSTNTTTPFVPEDYGVSLSGGINDLQEVIFNNKTYLLVADSSGLVIFNLTDNVGYRGPDHGSISRITPDVSRSRFGVYVISGNAGAGEMKSAYWELSQSGDPFTGSTFTYIPENTANLIGTDVVRIFASPIANEYYISVYATGLFRFNDNNTPTNFSDDQGMKVIDPSASAYNLDSIFSITFDPQNRLIIGTSGQQNGELFVVTSDGDTPYDSSDDTIFKLANARQLSYGNVYGLTYVVGENAIGDQIFVETESGNPTYVNFNSTYTDLYDDTHIQLIANGGIRPSVTHFVVSDYNTLYADIDRQGLYKINLNRGWKSTGQAISLPPRPDKALAINNFTAQATAATPIAVLPASELLAQQSRSGLVPQAYADNDPTITYEISTDDGATWQSVTLGELQSLVTTDYRLQFRIIMTPGNGQSPVLNQYSLQYGAYPDVAKIGVVDHFDVAVSPTSFAVGDTVSVTVSAKDVLGFAVSDYSGTANTTLLTEADENVSSRLNISQLSFNAGVGTATGVVISQAGTYNLSVSNSDATNESSLLTVTGTTSQTVPTLSFTSSNHSPRSGETFTLRWVTTNMNNAYLNGKPVNATGSFDTSVTDATDYTLRATGAYGELTSTLKITLSNGTSPSPSPTPTASVAPGTEPALGGEFFEETETDLNENGETTNQPSTETTSKTIAPKLEVGSDVTILEGERATIWWNSPDADDVTVTYLGGLVGNKGEFQFFGRKTQTISIIARKGDQSTSKTVTITVKPLPINLGRILPIQTFPIVTATIRYSGITWLVLLILIMLLGIFKRKPDPKAKLSRFEWLIQQVEMMLWVVSPLVLALTLWITSVIGGLWLILVSVACIVVAIRHFIVWAKSWLS